ncbi:type II CAAX prenyl endopeptidase Rce1 family protein [Tsukamurella sp. PLM1]|uniref:CPBP family glutamic-type intramembrane protease n=1 Tax=Tsukamurella sp. PLM1 TaxID=2929795 RepID=UPI002058BAFE|nr:CPBP family glutamic-type intramembrane protease [Tsukamurella sp. PLM1]BDH58858.1 hypothetical protein MTP03_37970 [Tsukamurella sp. PLM1]
MSLRRFWVALAITSLPFYAWGAVSDAAVGPAGLPVSALMFVCPAIAAMVACGGVREPLTALARRPTALPLLGALVIPPAAIATASDGLPLGPELGTSAALYLVAAAFEEIGWSVVLAPVLLRRHSPVSTGLLIGVAWALWHVIPYVQAGYSIPTSWRSAGSPWRCGWRWCCSWSRRARRRTRQAGSVRHRSWR